MGAEAADHAIQRGGGDERLDDVILLHGGLQAARENRKFDRGGIAYGKGQGRGHAAFPRG